MSRHAVGNGRIKIDLNYSSFDVDYNDVLMIEDTEGDIIPITLEEAKFLVQELPKFIENFENTPKAKINKMIEDLGNEKLINTKESIIERLYDIKELL